MTKDQRWSHCPRPRHDELFSSWFTRLVKTNCADTIQTFQELMGKRTSFTHIETKSSVKKKLIDQLEPFIDMKSMGFSPFQLSAYMEEKKITRSNFINTLLPYPRYCPLCFNEDEIPYIRQIWQMPFITICPDHKILLFANCPSCRNPFQYWSVNWDEPIFSCYNCRQSLKDNYNFIARHKNIYATKFQDDLFKIYKYNTYQDEKINRQVLFENLWLVASTASPDRHLTHIKQGIIQYYDPERMFQALHFSYQKFLRTPRLFIHSPMTPLQVMAISNYADTEKLGSRATNQTELRKIAEVRYEIIFPFLEGEKDVGKDHEINCSDSDIEKWIKMYNEHGIKGLMPLSLIKPRLCWAPESESLMAEIIKENISKGEPLTSLKCWKRFHDALFKLGYRGRQIPASTTFKKRYDSHKQEITDNEIMEFLQNLKNNKKIK